MDNQARERNLNVKLQRVDTVKDKSLSDALAVQDMGWPVCHCVACASERIRVAVHSGLGAAQEDVKNWEDM